MKKLLAILLVVATLFCVAACDDDTDATTTTAPDSTTTTTKQDDTTVTTAQNDNTTTTQGDNTTTTDDVTTTTEKEETTTTTTKPLPRPEASDSNNWKQVVNNWFTSDFGGLQMKADGWKTYGLYSISMVPEAYKNQGQTNAICVAVYDADPSDVFAAKTKEDFESVLLANIDTFTETTVCGYPAYKAVVTGTYYVWVVNTPNHKYFINFMQVAGQADMHEIGKQMMATVEIFK